MTVSTSSPPRPTSERAALLERMYAAFNARELETVLACLHPEVDWPNGWEGGRLLGRSAVRDYWSRQWAAIDARVQPVAIEESADGRTIVRVRQVVRDPAGAILSDEEVEHAYVFEDGLVRAMDIRQRRSPGTPGHSEA
jgi:hypothetical protein